MLTELIGRHIQVYSVRGEAEVSDVGTLESFDDVWVKIRQDNASLYFSVFRIRLIKPL